MDCCSYATGETQPMNQTCALHHAKLLRIAMRVLVAVFLGSGVASSSAGVPPSQSPPDSDQIVLQTCPAPFSVLPPNVCEPFVEPPVESNQAGIKSDSTPKRRATKRETAKHRKSHFHLQTLDSFAPWMLATIGLVVLFLLSIGTVVWRVRTPGRPRPKPARPRVRAVVQPLQTVPTASLPTVAAPGPDPEPTPPPGSFIASVQPRRAPSAPPSHLPTRSPPHPPPPSELQEVHPDAPRKLPAPPTTTPAHVPDVAPSPSLESRAEAPDPLAELHQSLEALRLMPAEPGAPPSLHDLHFSLDRVLKVLDQVALVENNASIHNEVESIKHHLQFVDYFGALLDGLQANGQCNYTDSFGDQITFTTPEEWVNTFAVDVLDVFAEGLARSQTSLLTASEYDPLFYVADMYRLILSRTVPAILVPLGFDLVQTFPDILRRRERLPPDPATMCVVGQRPTPGFTGLVVETRQVGLTKNRCLHRQAEVVTG